MIGKALVIVGGAVFAVFIFFYSMNSQRAELAARDLGTYGGVHVSDWRTNADSQLAIAAVGLLVAIGGAVLARSENK